MRLALILVSLSGFATSAAAQSALAVTEDAWKAETSGQASELQSRLERAANATPPNAAAIRAYAEFLERYHDPAARAQYAKLAQLLENTSASGADRALAYRQLTLLDLEAGDRDAAAQHLARYAAAGGSGWSLGAPQARAQSPGAAAASIEIPGPSSAFARLAALAQDTPPADLLPALARNVVTNGYQTTLGSEGLEPTEYLKLVTRYLSQARELEKLAGTGKVLRIETCDSSATNDLLRVLGYRMRGGCGSDLVLETVNASRAFLTIDSGFPLAQLEQALRLNKLFTLDYHPSRVPVLYDLAYWQTAAEKSEGEFIDNFLSDPTLCRLYVGLSKLDPETAGELRRQVPGPRLKLYANVLDFFGEMFEIRDGKAVVPGGARAEKAWAELAGADPSKGGAFLEKLLTHDDGWLASYFDALARIDGPAKDYLTDPDRLKRFYTAIRGRVTSPGPARPVFRSNTDMLLLTARLRMDADGKPHIPGTLEVWKNLFTNYPRGKFDAKLTRAAPSWKDSDDVLEALFGLSRKIAENEPLKIFMALTDVDRNRVKPLEPGTADRLAREYREMSAQYSLFAEAPELSDKTILSFLDTARSISQIRDMEQRADAAGTFQALTGLWQIFRRQGSISTAQSDQILASLIAPFGKIQNSREVFDAGMGGVRLLLKGARSPAADPGSKTSVQDAMLDLLAGKAAADSSEVHTQMIQDMIRIFEAQKLVALNTLFDLADNLDSVGRGEKFNTALAAKLASRLNDIQLPHGTLTQAESSAMAFGYWTGKHVDAQRKINLRAAIEKAANDPQKLKDLRGQLAPFLRDTLVGFNYIHYAPPGAEVLNTNPLFVRSHDFLGAENSVMTWKTTEVYGSGWPENAGGRLMGSLSGLPYALANAEQNFLIPRREQALIWGDLAPQMIVTAVVPRWWNVSALQLHWVDVNMAYAESLLAEAALSAPRRTQVETTLARFASPGRMWKIDASLSAGNVPAALENLLPSEMYATAQEMAAADQNSPLAAALRRMSQEDASSLSARAISHTFGSPKPTLTTSFQPELLNLRTFPTLMGYSSRILAESWESNLLYYAALADQIHAAPQQLNVLVPEWTQQTVQDIFATHLEDWPALLRSLRNVGTEALEQANKERLRAARDQ